MLYGRKIKNLCLLVPVYELFCFWTWICLPLSPAGQKDDIDRAYFAVFDGHGGVDAANYSATHLHVNVGLHEEIVKNPAKALKCSFQKTDEMFLFKAKREVSG